MFQDLVHRGPTKTAHAPGVILLLPLSGGNRTNLGSQLRQVATRHTSDKKVASSHKVYVGCA